MVRFNLRWRALSAGVDDPRWREPAAAVFYGVTSTALAFINKAVLSSYDFNLPFLIMTLQMVLTVSSLWVLTRWGVVSLPPYTLAAGWSFKWPSLFCAMHGVLSLYALSGLNIPMYGTLKRCTPLVNLLLSVVLLKKGVPSCLLTSSILLITAGCIIAAVGDLAYDAYAYTLGMMSVLAQGLYQSLVQYHAEQQKMSSSRILQLNSYNTLWPMVFFSVVVGEPRQALNSPHWRDSGFLLALVLIVVVGSLFNYALFLCTAVTSALTTSLVGVAKNVVQTLGGFFAFGGVRYHPLNVTGIVMNTAGGFLYAYVKYREKLKSTQVLPKYEVLKDQNLNHVLSPHSHGARTAPHELMDVRIS